MAYDPKAVANYFLDLGTVDGESITPMKLQKLLFYAHGWHLALTGEPLISDTIEAWFYGPVVPSVYNAFKRYGNEPIDAPAQAIALNGDAIVVETPELPAGEAHQATRDILKRVWEVYKSYSATQLSSMTHTPDAPWSQVVKPYQGKVPFNLEIPDNLIRRHFVGLVEQGRS